MKYSADDKQSREGPAPPALNHFAVLPADMASDSSYGRCHSLAHQIATEVASRHVEGVDKRNRTIVFADRRHEIPLTPL
jgi:hypothetical protein